MVDEYIAEGIPFLRSQNIKPFHIDLEGVKFISEDFNRRLKKSALRPGDLAVIRTGYPGTAAVIPDSLLEANCADLVVITPGPTADPFFLTALFNSTWGLSAVGGRLVGSAQQHFNVAAARSLEVLLPPLRTQRKITAILSAYEDLIENHTRRIKMLEEMAQRIYREWFVDFRYPGHENVPRVDSDLGPIPDGWEVSAIGAAVSYVGGGTPSRAVSEYWEDGDISWFTPTDLTSAGQMFMSTSKTKISALGLARSSARLFPARSVMLTSRATIGVVAIATRPACTNQGFITCIPTDRLSEYHLYFWLDSIRETIVQLASGATFREINKATFRAIKLVVPPAEIERRFHASVASFGEQVVLLQEAVAALRKARDLLLPRLISGEIDVEHLDIQVPEAA